MLPGDEDPLLVPAASFSPNTCLFVSSLGRWGASESLDSASVVLRGSASIEGSRTFRGVSGLGGGSWSLLSCDSGLLKFDNRCPPLSGAFLVNRFEA